MSMRAIVLINFIKSDPHKLGTVHCCCRLGTRSKNMLSSLINLANHRNIYIMDRHKKRWPAVIKLHFERLCRSNIKKNLDRQHMLWGKLLHSNIKLDIIRQKITYARIVHTKVTIVAIRTATKWQLTGVILSLYTYATLALRTIRASETSLRTTGLAILLTGQTIIIILLWTGTCIINET